MKQHTVHTDAPWRVEGLDVLNCDGEIVVAQTADRHDAYLIAAAPTMLKMLEDLHDRMSLGEPTPAGFLTVLESVLAKAKGLSLDAS